MTVCGGEGGEKGLKRSFRLFRVLGLAAMVMARPKSTLPGTDTNNDIPCYLGRVLCKSTPPSLHPRSWYFWLWGCQEDLSRTSSLDRVRA